MVKQSFSIELRLLLPPIRGRKQPLPGGGAPGGLGEAPVPAGDYKGKTPASTSLRSSQPRVAHFIGGCPNDRRLFVGRMCLPQDWF